MRKPHQSNQAKTNLLCLMENRYLGSSSESSLPIFETLVQYFALALALEWHIFGISDHDPNQSSNRQCVSEVSLDVAVKSKHIPALPCFIRAC